MGFVRNVTTAALAVALTAGLAGISVPAFAQSDDEAQRRSEQRETRRVESLSQGTYEVMEGVYEAIQNEQYAAAQQELRKINNIGELPPYDQAIIQQAYGYIYAGTEDYARAVRAFEQMVSVGRDVLQVQQLLDTQYYIAQLYMALEQYGRAINGLQKWFDQVESPSADAYFLMAQAHTALERYRDAIPWNLRAINTSRDRGNTPKENYFQLIRGLYFETDQIGKAVEVLETLVDLYPKKQYWMQLSAGYGLLGQEEKQFTTLEAAYHQGLLSKSQEFEELTQRYMYHGIPYRAAVILEEGLNNKTIERDKENLELVANAFYQAQELDRAIPWYQRAASASDKADLYILLGQIHLQRQEWSEAVESFQNAVEKNRRVSRDDKLSNPGNAHLMMGVAYFNLDQLESARQQFRAARGYDKTKKQANSWLTYVDNEEKRREMSNQVLQRPSS